MKQMSNKPGLVPTVKVGAKSGVLTSNVKRAIDALSKPAEPEGSARNDASKLDGILRLPKTMGVGELVGRALVTLGVVSAVLLTQLILISQSHFQSAQLKALDDFRYQLANGTAPIAQVDGDGKLIAPGTPVAILQIKKLNLSAVVLEGTTSQITMDGPGHRRDTVLPGQAGISVVYGRQAGYGGSFGNLSSLKPGDQIVATTGQGESTYQVTQVRRQGDTVTNALTTAGRLTLVSAAGIAFAPDQVIRVDADLVGDAKTSPIRVIPSGAIAASEQAMGSDQDAFIPAIFLLQLLVLVLIGLAWVRRHWGRIHAWVIGLPLLLWLGSTLTEQIIRLLPNLI